MASSTAQTEWARATRRQNMGRKARNQRTTRGSTPVFPVHTPEADKNEAESVAAAQSKD